MSTNEDQNNDDGQPPKSSMPPTEPPLPRGSSNANDYFSKFNAILSKEIGLTAEKFRDLQENNTPEELFNFLDNAKMLGLSGAQQRDKTGKFKGGSRSPIKTYAQGNSQDKIPGKSRGGEKLVKGEGFKLSRSFDPRTFFGSNKLDTKKKS